MISRVTLDRTQPQAVFGGVPSFFAACCWDASRCGPQSLGVGYSHPAYELTRGLRRQVPYDCDYDEWPCIVDGLAETYMESCVEHPGYDADADARILDWYCQHFPKCMEMVPRRRRYTFLAGVYAAIRDGHLDD